MRLLNQLTLLEKLTKVNRQISEYQAKNTSYSDCNCLLSFLFCKILKVSKMNHTAVIREAVDNSTSYAPVFHFLPMNDFVAAINVICSVVGIPMNVLTAVIILLKSRLHQTRNVLWLGVAFSNVLILLYHLVETYAYQFQSEAAEKIFILVLGLPHGSLALNLFLSLVDRYVCIAHSVWYKRKVTTAWIISVQIGCFSILCVLTKGHYLLQSIPLPEELAITNMKIIGIVGLIIVSLCTVGQAFLYFKVKHYLDLGKNADTSVSSHIRAQYNYKARQPQANNMQTTEFMGGETPQEENSLDDFQRHRAAAASLQNRPATTSSFFIQVGNNKISRLELKSALLTVDSILLSLLFSLPSLVALLFAISADCFSVNMVQKCSPYLWALTYTRGFLLFYTIVSPIFCFTRSHDLSQALNRIG